MSDPESSEFALLAPGQGGSVPARLPGIDERLAPPETRLEYLGGTELFAAPAKAPHATQHFDLTYVLGAHVSREYRGAVDLLTRTGEVSDFAPDASVFPIGADETTGDRKLEELAFEIADEQAVSVPTQKARELVARGVRRVFLILVKQHRMLEWSRETDAWSPLHDSSMIDDRCFARPLPVSAVLDGAAADDAVAGALLDRKVPALERALDERAARAKAEAVLDALDARGLVVTAEQRDRIFGCADIERLRRWSRLAVAVSDAEALFDE